MAAGFAAGRAYGRKSSRPSERENDDTGFDIGHSIRKTPSSKRTTDDYLQEVVAEATQARERSNSQKELTGLPYLVNSTPFSVTVAVLIALNSIMLGVETDYNFSKMEGIGYAFGIFQDFFFTVAFTLELLVKMWVFGPICFIFRAPDRVWNIIDVILVGVSFAETFVLSWAIDGESDLAMVSVFRIFRLLRVVRLVRLIRIFKQLALFVTALADAIMAIFWGVFLTGLIIYMAAIFFTRSLAETCSKDEAMYSYFGSVSLSMLTLFQVTTLDGWNMIVRRVMALHPWMVFVFLVFICITSFAFLNVVVAVIVETVLKVALADNDTALRDMVEDLRRVLGNIYNVFENSDADQNGKLTREEFLTGLHNPQVQQQLAQTDICLQELEDIFDLMDEDGSQELSLDEFVHGCLKSRGPAKAKEIFSLEVKLRRMQGQIDRVEENIAVRLNAVLGEDGVLAKRLDRIEASLGAATRETSRADEPLSPGLKCRL